MNIVSNEQIKNFKKEGISILPHFLSKGLWEEMINYLEKAEKDVINRFRGRKRNLLTEVINDKKFIKYFEFPLEDNA